MPSNPRYPPRVFAPGRPFAAAPGQGKDGLGKTGLFLPCIEAMGPPAEYKK
jgi:hypothetical protein